MTANFLDDFKSVRIFPDADANPQCRLFCFANQFLFRGEGVPKIPLKETGQKPGIFGPKTPFAYISALFGLFHGLFGSFLNLSNTQTPF